MKIIETHAAPNPRRVRIFLAEKGITVPLEEIDLMSGVLKSEAMTAVNPMQAVPILQLDDGTTITETVAICRYFEELHPEPALFGRGAVGRATIEMWNRRMELGLFHAIGQVFRHLHPKMAALEVPQVAPWGESNKAKAFEMLRLLDRQLARSEFVAGAAFSIADITTLVAIDFMKPARIPLPEDLTNITRWRAGVQQRPSTSA